MHLWENGGQWVEEEHTSKQAEQMFKSQNMCKSENEDKRRGQLQFRFGGQSEDMITQIHIHTETTRQDNKKENNTWDLGRARVHA